MNRPLFAHRSSRVIAACRLLLALLLALWVAIDPAQPVRAAALGQGLLAGYVALSLGLVRIAWHHWWLDHRLALPALLLDITAFVTATYFTEGSGADFVSPYIAFFTLIVLSATLRWHWRRGLAAATIAAAGYLLAGFLIAGMDSDLDIYKFLRRTTYMAVISMIVVWLADRRNTIRPPMLLLDTDGGTLSPLAQALDYAMRAIGATGGSLAWAGNEEPRERLERAGSLTGPATQLPPEPGDADEAASPRIFDAARRRQLVLTGGDTITARRTTPESRLAAHLGVGEGMAVPVRGNMGSGELVLTGIPGLVGDDLLLGSVLAAEIARGLDLEEASALSREAAVGRLRSSLARDLHDSVAQTLAGTRFRLQALRDTITGARDPLPDLDAIAQSVEAEQKSVRAIIQRLRRGELSPGSRNLGTELAPLLASLARQWNIAANLEDPGEPLAVPRPLIHELQQIVREAIANAVRHGAATTATVRIHDEQDSVRLSVADDGRGFPEGETPPLPRSISERVALLGGSVAIVSRPGETRVEITAPTRGRP